MESHCSTPLRAVEMVKCQVRSGELAVPGTSIRVALSEMFAELDA